MAKRWSRVHTADDLLAFLKLMQRKKVAKPCPGHSQPCANVTWYSTSSMPHMRVCQECHQRLFGGTPFSKTFSPCSEPSISCICHGSFNYTKRMVDRLVEFDESDWEQFVKGMQIRIQLPSCSNGRQIGIGSDAGLWYRYTKNTGRTRHLFICEACFLDYAHKLDTESNFTLDSLVSTKPRCMASLADHQMPDSPDIEHSRAEILRLLHGADMRCYARGTVGVTWSTTRSNPRGYGVCEGCYLSKVKPLDAGGHYIPKKNVGRRASFACWMNSFTHSFDGIRSYYLKH